MTLPETNILAPENGWLEYWLSVLFKDLRFHPSLVSTI